MDIGGLVRSARLAAGLTQSELAERMGTSQAAVARLEGGDSNPRVNTVRRAVEAAGRRLQFSAEEATTDVDELQVARHLRLTPAERATVHDRAYRESASLVRRSRRMR